MLARDERAYDGGFGDTAAAAAAVLADYRVRLQHDPIAYLDAIT